MRRGARTTLVLLLLVAVVPSPARSDGDDPAPRAKLTIVVKDLRNRKGVLIFSVFTGQKGFPNVEKHSVVWQTKDAGDDEGDPTFTVELPPGTYAASVLHDENKSGEMDRNLLGVPKEGYGVTNNPKPKRRAATFKEAKFDLPAEGAERAISIQYDFL